MKILLWLCFYCISVLFWCFVFLLPQALLSSEPKSSSCSLLKMTMRELIALAMPSANRNTDSSTVPQVRPHSSFMHESCTVSSQILAVRAVYWTHWSDIVRSAAVADALRHLLDFYPSYTLTSLKVCSTCSVTKQHKNQVRNFKSSVVCKMVGSQGSIDLLWKFNNCIVFIIVVVDGTEEAAGKFVYQLQQEANHLSKVFLWSC